MPIFSHIGHNRECWVKGVSQILCVNKYLKYNPSLYKNFTCNEQTKLKHNYSSHTSSFGTRHQSVKPEYHRT